MPKEVHHHSEHPDRKDGAGDDHRQDQSAGIPRGRRAMITALVGISEQRRPTEQQERQQEEQSAAARQVPVSVQCGWVGLDFGAGEGRCARREEGDGCGNKNVEDEDENGFDFVGFGVAGAALGKEVEATVPTETLARASMSKFHTRKYSRVSRKCG